MTDTDLMPFGKYKGTAMTNVPPKYLLWLYENGVKGDIKEYIEDNMDAIKLELKREQTKRYRDDSGVGGYNAGEFYK